MNNKILRPDMECVYEINRNKNIFSHFLYLISGVTIVEIMDPRFMEA